MIIYNKIVIRERNAYISGGISLSFMNEHDNMKEQTNLLKAMKATDQAAR